MTSRTAPNAVADDTDREALAYAVMTVTLGSDEGCDCDLPPGRLDDDAALAVADAVISAGWVPPSRLAEERERIAQAIEARQDELHEVRIEVARGMTIAARTARGEDA